jgi:hypothetical protein
MSNDFKEESRKNWTSGADDKPTREQLQLGCLQRIADATEAMANEYNRLLSENKWLSKSRKNYATENEKLVRSNSALRGVITKMKNKQAQKVNHE